MRSLLRRTIVNFLSLYLIARILGAISYSEDFLILFWAAIFLTLFNFLVKPVLNLFLMPINTLTLGAFSWVTNVIILFLVTLFVGEFKILVFASPGFSYSGFIIPSIHLTLFWSFILVSFLIELFNSILNWALK